MPKAEAIAAAPGRAETLGREAAEAVKEADEAKKAAATTAREAAALTMALRKLELAKKNADAELAFAEKVLANAKTDQAKTQAEERKQKAAAKAEEATQKLDAAKADTKVAAAAAAKDAAKAADKKKADLVKAAADAKLALEPVSIYISRATQKLYVRRNTHKPAPDGGGEVFDTSIEVPVTIRDSGQEDRHPHLHGDGEERRRPALERGLDRRRGRCEKRARPHQHPAGGARPHRTDRVAAILDRHFRRAAEQGNQLSHRVRRRAERPAAGRLHHAQADAGRRCRQQLVGR